MTRDQKIGALLDTFLNLHQAPFYSNDDELYDAIRPLIDAAEDDEWDIIAEAAKMLTKANASKMAAYFARRLAASIQARPHDFGLAGDASKADIIAILKTQWRPLYDLIPRSPSGLTLWWKEVDCGAPQSRGGPSKAIQKLYRTKE